MENAVFLELMRATNERPILEIYYWKHNHKEVDFILKEGASIKELIQVTYARGRDEIDKRETKSLLEASEKTGCNTLTIITWDYGGKNRNRKQKNQLYPPLEVAPKTPKSIIIWPESAL